MHRRTFIKNSALSLGGLTLGSIPVSQLLAATETPEVVWVEHGEPVALVRRALEEFGGMKRFVSKGDIVIVKPNIGWDRAPEFAATTNPELVAEVIIQCFNAGAKKVKVFDRTCNNPIRCYRSSQIEAKAKSVGADVSQVRDYQFVNIALKNGDLVKEWSIHREYLEADKVINIPIAKQHSMCEVTLGMKNLMGVMGGERGNLHNHFSSKLPDIAASILPTLTIIDAYRMLTFNGPVGGNLDDVKLTRTLVMSPCIVSADVAALDLFGLNIKEVGYLEAAIQRGLNKYDVNHLKIKKIALS